MWASQSLEARQAATIQTVLSMSRLSTGSSVLVQGTVSGDGPGSVTRFGNTCQTQFQPDEAGLLPAATFHLSFGKGSLA